MKIVDGIKITKIINYIIVELKFEIGFVSKQITLFDTSTAYTIIFKINRQPYNLNSKYLTIISVCISL